MDAAPLLLIATGCLALGVLVGWALRAGRAAADHAASAAAAATADAAASVLREQLALAQRQCRELDERSRDEQTRREERERREQVVLRALEPVRETLASMQRKVDDLENDRHRQYGALEEQLRHARESDEALRTTTESLAGALRSGTTRGVWGETQLRRVIESAGLTRHVDFDLQASISSDVGAGRPDLVVRLPGGKALAVDAKVPLDAFLEASAIPFTAVGDGAARRRTLLERHVKAVRAHVDALSRKSYWSGLDASPEFVICFLPSESLLATALDEDPALLEYAFGKRVALASPVNLWAVLKTVAFTWTQQDVSHEARRLFDLGNELYGRLASLAGHADDLRRAIERTVDSYNRFAGSLESRVLVSARRFPGIDQTKLDSLDAPAPIERAPRRLTAAELMPADPPDPGALTADVGAVRGRITDAAE